MTESIVHAVGIAKSFGRHPVLADIDFSVPEGSVLALLGPNGAGKTTLVRILTTLTRPDAGTATIAGFDLRREPRKIRSVISLTGQFAAVDEFLTGEENIRLMTRLWHLDRVDGARRGRELLERFDLMDARGRPVKTYSGGMRRRLDLALSLVSRPKLLFLDEPTTGLDPRSRVTLWESVKELASAGVTVFLTTQYLEEADTLADRVAILDGGRIIAEGTPEQLKLRIGGETATLVFPNLHHLVRATAKLGERARPLTSEGDALSVSTSGDADDLRRLLNELSEEDIRVAKLTLREPTLDDVFFTLTGRPAQPQEAA